MKIFFFLAFVFLIAENRCYGKIQIFIHDDTLPHKSLKIIIFDDNRSVCTQNEFIDPTKVVSGNLMPDSSSKEVCQLLNVDVVIVLKLKPGTKLLTLNNVFNLYKINLNDRNLPVEVDEKKVDFPETMLISQNQIDFVKVINHRKISIILKDYYETIREFKGGPFRLKQH
jgi:hypothetical protein